MPDHQPSAGWKLPRLLTTNGPDLQVCRSLPVVRSFLRRHRKCPACPFRLRAGKSQHHRSREPSFFQLFRRFFRTRLGDTNQTKPHIGSPVSERTTMTHTSQDFLIPPVRSKGLSKRNRACFRAIAPGSTANDMLNVCILFGFAGCVWANPVGHPLKQRWPWLIWFGDV